MNEQNEKEQGQRDDGPREDEGLGALAKDIAHPFDQTNGIVDGLEGNEDDPERVDERLGGESGVPVAGPSGGQPGVAPTPMTNPGLLNDDLVDEDDEGLETDDADDMKAP